MFPMAISPVKGDRKIKVKQKVSGGFQTEQVADDFMNIKTAKKMETLNSKQYWLFLSGQANRHIYKAFYI